MAVPALWVGGPVGRRVAPARKRFIRGRLLPGTAGRVGRGFRTVPGYRQDSYVCRRPGRSSEWWNPAGTHRPRGGTSGLPEIVVRLPHPVPRGEGARGLRVVPVDGAEPHLAHLADDLARHGPGVRAGRPHHRRARSASRDRGGPRAAPVAPGP